jgi:formate dehydrogenase subunit delta
MHIEQLVIMANDIANFFRSGSDPGAGARQVANHLRLYWDPRMRKQIIEHLESGGSGLSDLSREAVGLLEKPPANTSAGGPAPSPPPH